MNNIDKQQRNDALDAQIDRALSVLRRAVPPDGLQDRVLHRVRRAAVDSSRQSLALSRKFAAVGCVMAAVFAVTIYSRMDTVRRDEAAASSPAQTGSLSQDKHPRAPQALPYESPAATSSHHLALVSTRTAAPSKSGLQKPALTEEVAYAEMKAPSKPAPEMPLTQQEKLLLRVAHRADTSSQVAELRRPVWPLHDPDQDDNFEQFFHKPLPTPYGDAE